MLHRILHFLPVNDLDGNGEGFDVGVANHEPGWAFGGQISLNADCQCHRSENGSDEKPGHVSKCNPLPHRPNAGFAHVFRGWIWGLRTPKL